jgi:cytosine/adenosine deaminase-related metal-dependent hydrolase
VRGRVEKTSPGHAPEPGAFFAALTDVGHRGAVCVEMEDRAYEGSLADRQRALRQSWRFLEQWVSG